MTQVKSDPGLKHRRAIKEKKEEFKAQEDNRQGRSVGLLFSEVMWEKELTDGFQIASLRQDFNRERIFSSR